jgi:hypothetical protein
MDAAATAVHVNAYIRAVHTVRPTMVSLIANAGCFVCDIMTDLCDWISAFTILVRQGTAEQRVRVHHGGLPSQRFDMQLTSWPAHCCIVAVTLGNYSILVVVSHVFTEYFVADTFY